jgi:hypothetical protein
LRDAFTDKVKACQKYFKKKLVSLSIRVARQASDALLLTGLANSLVVGTCSEVILGANFSAVRNPGSCGKPGSEG